MLHGTVYNGFDTANVRFPRSVGMSVRVRNLASENYAFTAVFTFSHDCTPPYELSNKISLRLNIKE
jgi:hypothetical protein